MIYLCVYDDTSAFYFCMLYNYGYRRGNQGRVCKGGNIDYLYCVVELCKFIPIYKITCNYSVPR